MTLPKPPANDPSGIVFFKVVRQKGGKLLVTTPHLIYRLLPDGRRDRHFGVHGKVEIASAPDRVFSPTDVTTDPQGRVLVAGTTVPATGEVLPGSPELPGPISSWATVKRYLPGGKVDDSFGSKGTVESSFGLPAPIPTNTSPLREPAWLKATSVDASKAVVDDQGRILVAGSYFTRSALCYSGAEYNRFSRAYVARLSASGSLEMSLTAPDDPDFERASALTSLADGGVLLGGEAWAGCQRFPIHSSGLIKWNADGTRDLAFGEPSFGPQLALDRHGRLLIAEVEGPETEVVPHVTRLRPSGTIDHSYGHRGRADLPPVISYEAAGPPPGLAVDRQGRALVAVYSGRLHRGSPGTFRLMRVRVDGKLDHSFGWNGIAGPGLPHESFVGPRQVFLSPRGTVTVLVEVADPGATSASFVLLRYLNNP